MLEFSLMGANFDKVCVLVGQIVGFSASASGKVTLHMTGGQAYLLAETYDVVRDKIRNATAPGPYR